MKKLIYTFFISLIISSCTMENALLLTGKQHRNTVDALRSQHQKEIDSLMQLQDSLNLVINEDSIQLEELKESIADNEEKIQAYTDSLMIIQEEKTELSNTILSIQQSSTDSLNDLVARNEKLIRSISTIKYQRNQLKVENLKLKERIQTLEKSKVKPQQIKEGVPSKYISKEGKKFTYIKVDITKQEVNLHHKYQGKVIQSFENVHRILGSKKQEDIFAMNAGMFHSNRNPVGLYIEDYKELYPIELKAGQGNFYMSENAVFSIGNNGADITLSKTYAQQPPVDIRLATQSGPYLLIDGEINAIVNPNSPNRKVRNGIGVIDQKHIVLLISDEAVQFYELTEAFRELGCKDAMYLDGVISGAKGNNGVQTGMTSGFGPIISVSEKMGVE